MQESADVAVGDIALATSRPSTSSSGTGSASASANSTGSAAELTRLRQEVWSLQMKVQELERNKLTVETSRDDLARRQTKYLGNIVTLQSRINSLEEAEGNQRAQIATLQEENLRLKRQLDASEMLLGLTPDKCRASQQSLQQDLLRVSQEAQRNEHHVRRLRLLVLNKVTEAEDSLRFAEIEREVLQAANDGLVEELAVARGLLQQQHAELETTTADSRKLAMKLAEALRQVEELRVRDGKLREAAAAAVEEADTAKQRMQLLASERDQAAANLRHAESELAGVQSLGEVMFKQVKGILHQLETHLGLYHTRELATIVRQLRDWVARNGPGWEGDTPMPSCLPSPAPAKTPRPARGENGALLPIPQFSQNSRPLRFVC